MISGSVFVSQLGKGGSWEFKRHRGCRNGHRLGFETMRSDAIAMAVQRWLDLSYMDSDGTARGFSLRLMTTAMECGV